jgi:hypothetical protein
LDFHNGERVGKTGPGFAPPTELSIPADHAPHRRSEQWLWGTASLATAVGRRATACPAGKRVEHVDGKDLPAAPRQVSSISPWRPLKARPC